MAAVRKHRTLLIAAAVLMILCAAFAFLCLKQIIHINKPSEEKYAVRGVDVSAYQGDIDWQTLSQGLDFAYIKATEGSSFVDERFAYNYEQAQGTALRVGAYHFFSFDSSGKTQAENFISQVEPYERMLPPVVDVEFYGDHFRNRKSPDEVLPELRELLDTLEAYYGVKPVIYATGTAYMEYIEGNFDSYDLWIRNVYLKPLGEWSFWQWSSVGELEGYNGDEKYIDMNVFYGSREEFERYSLCKTDN